MRKYLSKYLLQVGTLLLIVGGVVAALSGCTLIIDSSNVNTEVVPAVSAIELVL